MPHVEASISVLLCFHHLLSCMLVPLCLCVARTLAPCLITCSPFLCFHPCMLLLNPADTMPEVVLNVDMACSGCSGAVERVLKKLEGGCMCQQEVSTGPFLSCTHGHAALPIQQHVHVHNMSILSARCFRQQLPHVLLPAPSATTCPHLVPLCCTCT